MTSDVRPAPSRPADPSTSPALVTGGSRGIGAAIAARLARDGHPVALTASASSGAADEVARGIRAAGGRAIAVRADSADPDDLRAAVAATVAEFGGLSVLVNNAGFSVVAPAAELALADLDRMYAVNVRAALAAVQAALPHLPAGGRVVTVGSVFADHAPPFGGLSGYITTKAALTGLTRALARELAPRAITVNIVQPGAVDTDINPADGPVAEVMTGVTPLGRYGAPAEIADVVSFLAGPGASFVTGATITADGGYST